MKYCLIQAFLLTFILSMVELSPTTGVTDPLERIIKDKEAIVEGLANATREAFQKRCKAPCNGTQCVFSACGSLLPQDELFCTEEFGGDSFMNATCTFQCPVRHLPIYSNILTSEEQESSNTMIEKCWTAQLEHTFMEIYQEDRKNQSNLRWQYIGTPSGLVRLFPYYTQRTCYTLDPRLRPWYVSATSGPKTVIIVLDVSASMLNYGRLQLAKDAVITVVSTLTYVDNVGIVLFGDQAIQLRIPQQKDGQLLRATNANISALRNIVNDITVDPSRGTNFEAAFQKAFDILDKATIECNSAILFLTDGHPNKGLTSEYRLNTLVQERNHKHDSIIFTYTLGSISGASLLRGIACASQGVYSHIDDGGNLREQLSQYYDYFASLRVLGNESVSWVEPYTDAAGAGLLVTVSKAVYDYNSSMNTPHLIGVVGADILVDDLEKAGRNAGLDHEEVIQRLASNNKCPVVQTESPCLLSQVRSRGSAVQCDSDNKKACPTRVVYNCTPPKVEYCQYKPNRYMDSPGVFLEQSCCKSNSTLTCTSNSDKTTPNTCRIGIMCLMLMIAFYT